MYTTELCYLSTKEVLRHHVQALDDRDLGGILLDYAPDASLMAGVGLICGMEAIRAYYEAWLNEIVPAGSDWLVINQCVERDVAHVAWKAYAPTHRVPMGSETLVVRNGKIETHTMCICVLPPLNGAVWLC